MKQQFAKNNGWPGITGATMNHEATRNMATHITGATSNTGITGNMTNAMTATVLA